MAIKRLQMEYKEYLNETSNMYSININMNNFFSWDVLLFGPPETIFEGGIFKCQINFPKDYPNSPPKFKFITLFPHPNIYKNGEVCISILHSGQDQYGYEHISERWSPSQNINSIIMSILVLLNNPNFDSPANLEASKLWRSDYETYKKEIYKIIGNMI